MYVASASRFARFRRLWRGRATTTSNASANIRKGGSEFVDSCGSGGGAGPSRRPQRVHPVRGTSGDQQSPAALSRGWAVGHSCIRQTQAGASFVCTASACARRHRSTGVPLKRMLGALSLMRSPAELDGEGLGRAATAAAREGLDEATWWSQLSARAKELAPTLALHDASLILNGMARMRKIDKSLVEALLPRICSHLVYLTSAHLAMIASAIAKSEVHNARFAELLTRELKARLMEFHSSMELTMIVNAVSKLRITDDELYRRFATHIQNRMGHEVFHVRDLSVIVGALARVQYTDAATISRFADCATQTLGEATPLELARLMHACMSVSCADHDFFNACVHCCMERTLSMDPSGLSKAAFAFGQCFEVTEVSHLPYMRKIFRHIRLASVASLPLFLPRELVSLLRTYARWQVTFETNHLLKVVTRMRSVRDRFDSENAVAALYSVTVLMQRNALRSATVSPGVWEALSGMAKEFLEPVWIAVRAGKLDAQTIVRAVESSTVLNSGDMAPVAAITARVSRVGRVDFDGPSRSALYEFFLELGCSPEDDLMMVLGEGLPSLSP